MASLAVLTAHDRCDTGDTAQAQTSWSGPNGGTPLLFCGHHSRQHGPDLLAQGFVMTGMDPVTLKAVKAEANATASAV